jgi:glycogen debranching enzyme
MMHEFDAASGTYNWAKKAELSPLAIERFEAAFWCEYLGPYALALDGDKRPCRVRASNSGQCLFGGITSSERGASVDLFLVRHGEGVGVTVVRWLGDLAVVVAR